jgi:hypothetical protein
MKALEKKRRADKMRNMLQEMGDHQLEENNMLVASWIDD